MPQTLYVDSPPSKKPRVDGPDPWPEHENNQAQRRNEKMDAVVSAKEHCAFHERNKSSGNRGQEAEKK